MAQTGGTAYSAKEETTTAATELGLLDAPLVGGKGGWLERVGRSSAAEPLRGEGYARPLTDPNQSSTIKSWIFGVIHGAVLFHE